MKCRICRTTVDSEFDLLEHGLDEHPQIEGMTIREARDILKA